jgi:ABC-type lipoprotein release transport system permease subunit
MIAVSAIAFGISFFIWLWAWNDGFKAMLVNNTTGYYIGHLQIAAVGFRPEYNPQFSISEPGKVEEVLKNNHRISAFSSRIETPSFISSATKSMGILLIAIDPSAESKVTLFPQKVTTGEYLRKEDDQAIILGKKLAENLRVEAGDKIVITISAVDGSLAQAAFRVKGVMDTGIRNLDGSLACITLSSGQRMLSLSNGVTTFVIKLKDQSQSEKVEMELKQKLSSVRYDVESWQEIMPILIYITGFYSFIMLIMLEVAFAVMAIGIANTIILSVIERTRELGVMMALGTNFPRLAMIIVLESILLGILGILLGNGLGLILVLITQRTGIDLTLFNIKDMPGAMSIVYPVIVVEHQIFVSVLVLVFTVLFSVFPLLRVCRLKPAEAIRFV